MPYRNTELEPFILPLPISQFALDTAQQFADRQPTPTKAAQVRLNTLAVCAVNDYLHLMGIETDLTASDSWNPVMQLCANVADLPVAGVGRLECRPFAAAITSLNQTCPVPPEVWADRIGYAIVQIDESDRTANLLGFVETAATEDLPLSQLRSPEALLDHLDRLLHPATAPQPAIGQTLTNLSQWMQNTFEAGWQTVESLLNPPDPQFAYAFRGDQATAEPSTADRYNVRRAKPIEINQTQLVLLIKLTPVEAETQIRLQLHPAFERSLPPDAQLVVLDGETPFLEARSREMDDYLQLEFSGATGESFSVCVRLGDARFTENFVI